MGLIPFSFCSFLSADDGDWDRGQDRSSCLPGTVCFNPLMAEIRT